MRLICQILRPIISGQKLSQKPEGFEENFPQEYELAVKNKIATLLFRAIPNEMKSEFIIKYQKKEQIRNSHINSHLLFLIRQYCEELNRANIKYIFYKGPLQQGILYGDFFAKPSNDIDLLVVKKDYKKSREILFELGYNLEPECAKLWWRLFLGEQHFFRVGSGRFSVDLHHKLQQPGAPDTKQLSRFFENTNIIQVGAIKVNVPSMNNIALIAAMNLVKGIYGRSSSGSHAIDLLIALRKIGKDGIDSLRAEARLQGHYNTLAFSSRVSALLFEVEDLFSDEKMDLPIDSNNIEELILYPSDYSGKIPKRTEMLYYLCDNKVIDYPNEYIKLAISDLTRRSKL